MTVQKLFIMILLAGSLIGFSNRFTLAQNFDVDIDNRILTIRTDNTDDIVELFVSDDALIIKSTQFASGSLSTGNFLDWASEQGEGYISDLAWGIGLRSVDRSRDLDDFDAIQIITYGGTDKILVNQSSSKLVVTSGGPGQDEIVIHGSSDGSYLGIREHYLFGDDGDDYIQSSWQARINGGADNDELHGSDSNDVLEGESGNDELFGHGGTDYLYGDSGMDYLDGGNDGLADRLHGFSDADELVHRYYKLEEVKHEYKYYAATWVFEDGRYIKKYVLRTRYIVREQRVYTETELVGNVAGDTLIELPDNN